METNKISETKSVKNENSNTVKMTTISSSEAPKKQTANLFLMFLTLAVFFQGFCTTGLVKVVITSLERRFHLNSAKTGTIASSFDIGSLMLMVPVTFFGGKIGANRPRYISIGLIIMAIGTFLWTIPHFATPLYNHEEVSEGSVSQHFYVFLLAQLLIGSGSFPLETLGIAYIDDNVDSQSSSLYIAIFQTGIVLGPAAGFVLGGQLLNFHTDFISNVGISSSSSLWVGAWWPGFIITAIGSIFCALCLYGFPKTLKDTKTDEVELGNNNMVLKDMMKELYNLLTNLPYVLISISDAVDFLILSGLSSFPPKYMEQWNINTRCPLQQQDKLWACWLSSLEHQELFSVESLSTNLFVPQVEQSHCAWLLIPLLFHCGLYFFSLAPTFPMLGFPH